MKVYTVTCETESDGWCGTYVSLTKAEAVEVVNEQIDEENENAEEGDEKRNRIVWPERQGDWRYDWYGSRYHFEEHNLEE